MKAKITLEDCLEDVGLQNWIKHQVEDRWPGAEWEIDRVENDTVYVHARVRPILSDTINIVLSIDIT